MSTKAPIGVLASGNGSNLQALIDAPLPSPIAVVVVNNPDAKAKLRAERVDIPTVVVDHRKFDCRESFDRALVEALRGHGVEWVVLAGFMRIVGAPLLEAFQRRIVNIHPALLPAFPGLHAQAQALAAGVKVSGCTVHLVDAGVDTGPILAQTAVRVLPGDDVAALANRILRQEHRLLPRVVSALVSGSLVEDDDGCRVHLAGFEDDAEAALACPNLERSE